MCGTSYGGSPVLVLVLVLGLAVSLVFGANRCRQLLPALPLGELAGQPLDVRISSVIDGKRGPELGVSLDLDGGHT